MAPRNLLDPAFFINRELSLLEFQRRVLEQAKDPSIPLLERMRFLAICSTNLDEFFEIRVSGLKQHLLYGIPEQDPDALPARERMRRIAAITQELVAEQYRVLNADLLPALRREGIRSVRRGELSARQAAWVKRYFMTEVLPVLTPMGLDPAHPFPRVLNKGLNFLVTLEGKDAFGRSAAMAVLQVPRSLPRVIGFPRGIAGGPHDFVLLSSVIHAHVGELFPGMKVLGAFQFRVTRNSDLWVDEEETTNLLQALKGELPARNYGDAVRLEVTEGCPDDVTKFLLGSLQLDEQDLYRVNGPVNLHRLATLHELVDRSDLKFPPFRPSLPRRVEPDADLFEVIRNGDILMHHPFESFVPVLDLLRQAASDPSVLAIKQTLYRTGADSPVSDLLVQAARNGKEVTAVVELRARFDEAANIQLASRLQEVGANVVYGIVGYKCHAKMLLIVRREGRRLVRYVHLGTGNYHTGTTRAYTDIGLLTSDKVIGEDVHRLFMQLTSLGKDQKIKKLLHAPFLLHQRLLELIAGETEAAKRGKTARIMLKVNALAEPEIIQALYRASRAGVEVDLIVRGACALRPGVPKVSENIRVRSIVGRFLEHSRVYYFHAGGKEIVYCSSADLLPRNFFRRFETAFPIEDPRLKARIITETLAVYLTDNTQSWILQSDGSHKRLKPGKDKPRSAQEVLLSSITGS